MATKEIKMPHLGESVTEAAIVQWLVKPGDSVKRYDLLHHQNLMGLPW
jgi:2-oxoisovalerate dehydrogenase E2 component (dihydrolipoyl transacylase)